MIFQLEAGSYSLAVDFTGKFSPYQGVQILPGPGGRGCFVAATENGNTAFVAYDPAAIAPAPLLLLASSELAKAANPIKSARRTLHIDTESHTAAVTTHRKTADSTTIELPLPPAPSAPFPPLAEAVRVCQQGWNQPADYRAVAGGRYSAALLRKVITAAEKLGDTVCLHGWDGGPLRVEPAGSSVLLLVMPIRTCEFPPGPPWLDDYLDQSTTAPDPLPLPERRVRSGVRSASHS